MSGSDTRQTPHKVPTARSWTDTVGSVLCSLVLTLGHFATGYLVVLAYLVEPAGPWDSESVADIKFVAGYGLAFCAGTALLTWVFVLAEWVRRWWYAIPAALAVAVLLRLTLLAPHL